MPPALDVPELLTPRLRLRGHRVGDFEASAAMWSSPDVTRHIGGRPFTAEESWGRVLRYAGHWALLGFGYWVVEERASGSFAGEVGLADFRRDVEPAFGDAHEAGWALAPWAQGRGLATEAMSAALAWHDAATGAARVVCMIDAGNAPSLAVAGKCGFRPWTETTYHGAATLLLARG